MRPNRLRVINPSSSTRLAELFYVHCTAHSLLRGEVPLEVRAVVLRLVLRLVLDTVESYRGHLPGVLPVRSMGGCSTVGTSLTWYLTLTAQIPTQARLRRVVSLQLPPVP